MSGQVAHYFGRIYKIIFVFFSIRDFMLQPKPVPAPSPGASVPRAPSAAALSARVPSLAGSQAGNGEVFRGLVGFKTI